MGIKFKPEWLMGVGGIIVMVSVVIHIFLKMKGGDASFSMLTIPLGFLIGVGGAFFSGKEGDSLKL